MLSHYQTDSTIPHEVVSKMIDDDMTIYQAWRTHKKMTQSEVAERMGIPQSNVSRIESGKTSPSFQTIKAYAKALDLLPEQLDLGWISDKSKLNSVSYDSADYLNTPKDISAYLQAAIDENDPEFFIYALGVAGAIQGHERD